MDDADRRLLCLVRPRVRLWSLATAAGYSLVHTHRRLVRLRAAGLVTWEVGRWGTLTLTPAGREALGDEGDG